MSTSYDLLIVTDATASMGAYLNSLQKSIPEILALAKLSGAFNRVGVLAYRDYSDLEEGLIVWSGWNPTNLQEFVDQLAPYGGGDYPEAAKTALIRALQYVDKHSKTLILWYTDAPPHHISCASINNHASERKAFPEGATDWVTLCYTAVKRNCCIFSFAPVNMPNAASSFYVLLSQLTGGICIKSKAGGTTSTILSRLTLDVILHWMGQSTSDMEKTFRDSGAKNAQFQASPKRLHKKLKDENRGSLGYLPPSDRAVDRNKGHWPALLPMVDQDLKPEDIPLGLLASHPFNLIKRFTEPSDERAEYQDIVYTSLASIIASNVAALTYNPIFGQLWRAVCRDTGDRKTGLINAFSAKVSQVKDPEKKEALDVWLENSFDATEEIQKIIDSAPVLADGKWVYLDLDADVNLTRIELLEVSKSCYSGVLKKVASIFTHLKIVEDGIKLTPDQRSIPLSLAPQELFRILPHLVVPGTMYPPRAAFLTAILALITGVPFLREPAIALLSEVKGKWINLEVPENISFECAKFLLSAPEGLVLNNDERKVYEAMRRYKLIELNLDSSVNVRVPWTPQKTRGVGDRKHECKKCGIRRSVSIMSSTDVGVCGMCILGATKTTGPMYPRNFPGTSEQESCWVECSTKTCRAQYVVENVAGLRIRPRCYYCRSKIACPHVECATCTNRIIIPKFYRISSDAPKTFQCFVCSPNSQLKSIVDHETTTRVLNAENGVAWLGMVEDNPDVLTNKSAFKLMQAHGPSVFGHIPSKKQKLALTLDGKRVHNPMDALAAVEERVGSGEVELGNCSLCFTEIQKGKLVVPCGRKGCTDNKVDADCLQEWYGKSKPGELLRLMELFCPFCRRPPAVKTLARYNPQAAALGGVQAALADRQWLYAWCWDCGFAKRAQERVCCQGDRVPHIEGFRCEECLRPPVEEVVHPDSDIMGKLGRITACPKCGVLVEKIEGCNHVVCSCGQHFCHACGFGELKSASSDIYGHMMDKHGGYSGAQDDDD